MAVRADTAALEKPRSHVGLFLKEWNVAVARLAGMLLMLIPINSPATGLPLMRPASLQSGYTSLVQKVHVLGEDDRWVEDEFSGKEHIAAQSLSGLIAIDRKFSGIVPVQCFYTKEDGISYASSFNGVNICNPYTVLINIHSLRKCLCEDTKNNFVGATIPGEEERVFFEKPEPDQLMWSMNELCQKLSPVSHDIAILHAMKPLGRTPLRVGHVIRPQAILFREVLAAERNVGQESDDSENLGALYLTVAEIYEFEDKENVIQSNIDTSRGSSGRPVIVNQNGRPLSVGILVGGYGHGYGYSTRRSPLVDEDPFKLWRNFAREIYFSDKVVSFIKRNVSNAESCIEEVVPPGQVNP